MALRLGVSIERLLCPLRADLGAEGHEVRLALYTTVDFASNDITLLARPFFVHSLPPGIDAILGLPWICDSGVAVSSSLVFALPAGPHEPIVDVRTGRFLPQPDLNFKILGFVNAAMDQDDQHQFPVCSLIAGITGLDEHINYEPYNPLLDEVDDPLVPDLGEAEFWRSVDLLLAEFADTLVSELPDDRPAPFRPENHHIPIINPSIKTRPRTYPMPDKFKAQWAAHANKFVESGWWSPEALDSACVMFAVPKHDRTQARFVVNLKPRNANTVKMHTPIPNM